MERDERVEEGPPELSGHVHGLDGVEQLLLVAVPAGGRERQWVA